MISHSIVASSRCAPLLRHHHYYHHHHRRHYPIRQCIMYAIEFSRVFGTCRRVKRDEMAVTTTRISSRWTAYAATHTHTHTSKSVTLIELERVRRIFTYVPQAAYGVGTIFIGLFKCIVSENRKEKRRTQNRNGFPFIWNSNQAHGENALKLTVGLVPILMVYVNRPKVNENPYNLCVCGH